jgi:peptidoglycan L-alanyl-D-glutamate endopeptidase CwlK
MLSDRSMRRMAGVHPELVRIVTHADTLRAIDFQVVEGMRSAKRQKELLAAGATTTLRSRHLTGHAVDLAVFVEGKLRWDWPLYHRLASVMRHAADEIGIPLEWGGDWKSFKDGPHFQLPWSFPEDEEE